jgi:hypothetical protein
MYQNPKVLIITFFIQCGVSTEQLYSINMYYDQEHPESSFKHRTENVNFLKISL